MQSRSVQEPEWRTFTNCLLLKTKALLRSAFDHMSESALARQVVKNHLNKVIELRQMLNDDRGYEFPEVIPAGQRGAADEMDETDETNETNETHVMGGTDVVDETGEGGGEGVEITAPNITDWDWQPAVKETVGNIKKRMNILETVAWCVGCGKKSGTRKSELAQWDVLNSHVAGKKGGRFFPYPECPDGPIEPKEQKKRAAEIQRKKAALNKIINKHKKRKR